MNTKMRKLFIMTSALCLGIFTNVGAKTVKIKKNSVSYIKQLEIQNGTTDSVIKIINKEKYSYAVLVLQKGTTKDQQEKIKKSLLTFRCNKENISLSKKVLICPIAVESLTNNDISRKYNVKEFPAVVIINDKGDFTNSVSLMNNKKLITNKSFNNLLTRALKKNIIKQKNQSKKEAREKAKKLKKEKNQL